MNSGTAAAEFVLVFSDLLCEAVVALRSVSRWSSLILLANARSSESATKFSLACRRLFGRRRPPYPHIRHTWNESIWYTCFVRPS